MSTLPSNKQIIIFTGPCCSNAHAIYLDQLAASGMAVGVIAVIDENHELYAQFAKELEASELQYSNGLNRLANNLAEQELTRIEEWAVIRNEELRVAKERQMGKVNADSSANSGRDDLPEASKAVEAILGSSFVGLSRDLFEDMGIQVEGSITTQGNTSLRVAPLPAFIEKVEDARKSAAIREHYQAEAIRLQIEMELARHNAYMQEATASGDLVSRLDSLEAALTKLDSQVQAMAAMSKHL